MKKILTIILATLLFASCTSGVNYRILVTEGAIRKTYTDEYVLTEICTGANGFGKPFWKKVSVVQRDTIRVENYERQ